MAKLLDGRETRDKIIVDLAKKVAVMGSKLTLAIVLVGDDPASAIYVREKEKAAKIVGIDFRLIKKPASLQQSDLEQIVAELNNDQAVTGIVVQKPRPQSINGDNIDLLI